MENQGSEKLPIAVETSINSQPISSRAKFLTQGLILESAVWNLDIILLCVAGGGGGGDKHLSLIIS